MEKLVAILWADAGQESAAFNARLLEMLPPALAAAGASGVRINIEDAVSQEGAMLRQSRGERQHDAVVQFWLPSANALFRSAADAAIAGCARAGRDGSSPNPRSLRIANIGFRPGSAAGAGRKWRS